MLTDDGGEEEDYQQQQRKHLSSADEAFSAQRQRLQRKIQEKEQERARVKAQLDAKIAEAKGKIAKGLGTVSPKDEEEEEAEEMKRMRREAEARGEIPADDIIRTAPTLPDATGGAEPSAHWQNVTTLDEAISPQYDILPEYLALYFSVYQRILPLAEDFLPVTELQALSYGGM